MNRLTRAAAALALSLAAHANDETANSYELSDEDRAAMMESANRYNTCLHEQSALRLNGSVDVRAIADEAMQECESILQHLDTALKDKGIAEDFRSGYIRHTKNTSVRRLLPELMSLQSGAADAAQ